MLILLQRALNQELQKNTGFEMKVVVDANIIISALLRDSTIRRLLFDMRIEPVTCDFLIGEIHDHLDELKEKKRDGNFEETLQILLSYVQVIPNESYLPFIESAKRMSPDIDDVPYVALAMMLDCVLWTQDKALLNNSLIKTISTKELMDLLGV